MYIEQGYALYLGQDAKTVPAVALFDKWMKKVSSDPNFEIESVYGWASAELFAQALQSAGNPPTRAGLIAALNKVTFFDAGGLVPPSDPAAAVPSGCFLLAQVQNGKIMRVPPSPRPGSTAAPTASEGARLHADGTADVVGEQMNDRRNARVSGRGPQERVVR